MEIYTAGDKLQPDCSQTIRALSGRGACLKRWNLYKGLLLWGCGKRIYAPAENGEQGLFGEAFNFSNEVQLSVLELVDRILEIMDSDLKPVILNQGEMRSGTSTSAHPRRGSY